MTLADIFALEDTENKDLNDDGVIGNAIASTYNVADESGVINTGFYRLASGHYITDNNGLTVGLKPTDNQNVLFKIYQELHHINLQRSQPVPLVIPKMVVVFIMKQRTVVNQYGSEIAQLMIEYLKKQSVNT